MLRRALQVPKAPEIVADRIRSRIVAGVVAVGEFLPPEARLMEEFGVSRPTLREAFRILEAQRLITVARGARGGAIVHAPDPELISLYTLLVLQSERTTVAEVFNTRRLLEPPIAHEVAAQGSAEAPLRLRAQLEREYAAVDDAEVFARAVADFHRTLVELSGNRPLIHLMQVITTVIEKHQQMVMVHSRRGRKSQDIRGQVEIALRSQKKLIDLIAARDADAAQAHWHRHMDSSHKAFVSGYEALTIHELLTQ